MSLYRFSDIPLCVFYRLSGTDTARQVGDVGSPVPFACSNMTAYFRLTFVPLIRLSGSPSECLGARHVDGCQSYARASNYPTRRAGSDPGLSPVVSLYR